MSCFHVILFFVTFFLFFSREVLRSSARSPWHRAFARACPWGETSKKTGRETETGRETKFRHFHDIFTTFPRHFGPSPLKFFPFPSSRKFFQLIRKSCRLPLCDCETQTQAVALDCSAACRVDMGSRLRLSCHLD